MLFLVEHCWFLWQKQRWAAWLQRVPELHDGQREEMENLFPPPWQGQVWWDSYLRRKCYWRHWIEWMCVLILLQWTLHNCFSANSAVLHVYGLFMRRSTTSISVTFAIISAVMDPAGPIYLCNCVHFFFWSGEIDQDDIICLFQELGVVISKPNAKKIIQM